MERSIPILEGCAARLASSKTVFWLQGITTVWMLVECAVSLYAASAARNVALLTFGADSLIELLSAIVVLLSFIPSFPIAKDRAPLGRHFAFCPGGIDCDYGRCDTYAWQSARVKLRGHGDNDCCPHRDANPGLAQTKHRQRNR